MRGGALRFPGCPNSPRWALGEDLRSMSTTGCIPLMVEVGIPKPPVQPTVFSPERIILRLCGMLTRSIFALSRRLICRGIREPLFEPWKSDIAD